MRMELKIYKQWGVVGGILSESRLEFLTKNLVNFTKNLKF